jgi:hypothetical protein
VGFVPQGTPSHEVVLDDGTVEPIPPPAVFRPLEPLLGTFHDQQSLLLLPPRTAPTPSWVGPSEAAGADIFSPLSTAGGERHGPTRRLPLGTVAGARSGDKGGDANIGIWVRSAAAYTWLSNLISAERVRELLPETAGLPVRITRLPNILAVNVVVQGLLGEGVAYNARFDPQAKGLGEWLRSRHVEIPLSLLEGAP